MHVFFMVSLTVQFVVITLWTKNVPVY